MSSGLTIKNIDRLRNKLKGLPQGATDAVLAELSAGAQNIRDDAQANAPNVEGLLKGSITYSELKDGRNGYTVGVRSIYGAFVEFGTRRKVNQALVSKYPAFAREAKSIKTGGTFDQMVESLAEWIRKKGILTNGKRGRRRKDDLYRLAAYWMAIRISQNGIKSQPYFFPAWEKNEPIIARKAGKALSDYIRKTL